MEDSGEHSPVIWTPRRSVSIPRSPLSTPPPSERRRRPRSSPFPFKRNRSVEYGVEMESAAQLDLNPLDIPEVVQMISENLEDVEDLKCVREVSKLWRDESLEQWRSTAVLILTDKVIQTLVKAYLIKTGGGDPNQGEEQGGSDVAEENVLELFKLFEKPFKNFRFCHRTIEEHAKGDKAVYPPLENHFGEGSPLKILWEQFLCKATFLDLGDCLMQPQENSVAGIKWILKQCPELKNLDFNAYHYQNTRQRAHQLENLVVDVIAPNLETLSYGKSSSPRFRRQYRPLISLLYENSRVCVARFQTLLRSCPNLKNLWTNADSTMMMKAAQASKHQFKSLVIFPEKHDTFELYLDLRQFKTYLETVRPPLKSLVLRLDHWRKCIPRRVHETYLLTGLGFVKESLTKLELYINCENAGIPDRALDLSNGGITAFANLTHLKLCLDYNKFRERLIQFEFGSLWYMKKLKWFWFEMGVNVAEEWVRRKLEIEDVQGNIRQEEEQLEEILLPDLEHFHFHSNFKSEAVVYLGKIATGLKTLEIVFDEENFSTALKTWHGLEQITLLPCSEVRNKSVAEQKQIKPEIYILDRSRDYQSTSDVFFECRLDYRNHQERRFSKLHKPR